MEHIGSCDGAVGQSISWTPLGGLLRTRILFTNGELTRDLLWVRHTGTDVYWGDPGQRMKGSYHASGAAHLVHENRRADASVLLPLRQIEGMCPLTTLVLRNSPVGMPDEITPPYRGGRADVIMTVDSRSLSEAQTHVGVYLLEPNRWDVLSNLAKPTESPAASYSVPQVLVAMTCSPWLLVLLGHSCLGSGVLTGD